MGGGFLWKTPARQRGLRRFSCYCFFAGALPPHPRSFWGTSVSSANACPVLRDGPLRGRSREAIVQKKNFRAGRLGSGRRAPRRLREEHRPSLHQCAALREQIAARVRLLRRIPEAMR